METYYRDNHITIYNKDCRDMSELPDNSVQCVITSPPYWGLRKYSGEQDLIWGDNHCEHRWGSELVRPATLISNKTGLHNDGRKTPITEKYRETLDNMTAGPSQGAYCQLCSAWKGAFGLEPTPEMYIQHTIEILREIRRVLRKDGVVFWNIGDSYASGKGSCFNPGGGEDSLGKTKKEAGAHPLHRGNISDLKVSGLKPKDLCLIPFRIAIAAQEDGWWVRSVIIWSKPNPMPESVTDRPTESHEYILMLTKSSRYYWDADAVREPLMPGSLERSLRGEFTAHSMSRIRNKGTGEHGRCDPAGRNIRTVWEFPTQPFAPGVKERPFAVFPEKLPEICIKAATPEVGCCSKCGKPWVRILDKKPSQFNIRVRDAAAGRATSEEGYKATQEEIDNYPGNHPDQGYRQTIGWQSACSCNADKVPSLVLDPFAGAGTTLWVAKKLNRQAVGYEISKEYCRLAFERNRQLALAWSGDTL